jgi:hypothetical protein
MIIDSPHKELTNQNRIELSVKKQVDQEYTLRGRMRLIPGLTLFEFDWKEMALKKSDIITCEMISFESKEAIERDKVVMNPYGYYFQAHNVKAAVRKINKMIFKTIKVENYFKIVDKQIIGKGL